MENNEYFTFIEEDETTKENEDETENPFVAGLPSWDLEPPYETIKRGDLD